jgi:ubiquinol-cytochrome c reductase iron-sulfur subunit
MAGDGVNNGRRRFLTAATSVVAGIGAIFWLIPFIKAWKPTARVRAAGAPVEVDVGDLRPGEMMTVEWRGRPVWIVRRTPEMLETLSGLNSRLLDPESQAEQQPSYAQNEWRSIDPDLLVAIGLCTHLGCVPTFVPDAGSTSFDSDWRGGFMCPCHLSKFDMAGRVYDRVPAPANLEVPPYRFLDERRILIGIGPEGVA